jgi:hypothetical protein
VEKQFNENKTRESMRVENFCGKDQDEQVSI